MMDRAGSHDVLVAVTRPGALRAFGLAQHLPQSSILVAAEHANLTDGLTNPIMAYTGALSRRIGGLFTEFDQLVFFLSVGAVVRLIAPHLRSKYEDPGVLVVDDAARFVIPVLSGHVGGANAYAERLAERLGATAVITTASDVTNTIAVDTLGRELGWQIEAPKLNLTRVAAHLVNGQPTAFVQETGSAHWWRKPGPLPENIHLFDHFEDVDLDQFRAVLWVTHREIPSTLWQRLSERLVVYRPPKVQP